MNEKRFNWQPVGIGVTLILFAFAAWINLNIKITKIETETKLKIIQIEKDLDKSDTKFDQIMIKLNTIELKLENKADRP